MDLFKSYIFLLFGAFLCFFFIACESSPQKLDFPVSEEESGLPANVALAQNSSVESNNLAVSKIKTPKMTEDSKGLVIFSKKEFLCALVSPDGKYILTSQEGYVGLKIYNVATEQLFATISHDKRIGFGAQWSRDSKKVFYKEKFDTELKAFVYYLETGQVEELKDINPNALQSYALAEKKTDPIISLNLQTLQVEKINLDGTQKTTLTNDGGQYYNPLLSPNKQKLIIQEGSKMYLVLLDGNSRKEIGDGIASCWSPDSKIMYYFMDESKDGHEVTGSEVYSYNTQTQTITKLTNTPAIIEMWPSISGDGKFLFCTDEGTGSVIKLPIK